MQFYFTFTRIILFFTYVKSLCFLPYKKYLQNQIPSQKIVYLKSNKQINIYKHLHKDIFILKQNNSDNFIEFETNKFGFKFLSKYNSADLLSDENILIKNILEKNIITISPGGLYGFYDAGICSMIKQKYNLDNCIFSGASAGAWNSLFISYKNNIDDLVNNILDIDINNTMSIMSIQKMLKEKILNSHSSEEFNLEKIYISVCVYENMSLHNYIYTDFVNLEDVINCCIASSNIPFITGNVIYKYNNKISFDAGIFKNWSFIFAIPTFNINNSIWGRKRFITSLFDNVNNNIKELYSEGINDTMNNFDTISKYFSIYKNNQKKLK